MAAIFTRFLGKFLAGLGISGATLVLFVPAIQDLIQAMLLTHPKWAPAVGFAALILAGFAPSASKAIGQKAMATDVENSAEPKVEQAKIIRQTQEGIIASKE